MRRRSRALRRLLAWLGSLVAAFLLTLGAVIVAYRFVRPPLTPLMVVRVLEGLPARRWVGVTKRWVDLKRVSPMLVLAVLAAEDTRFFEHHGVDLDALQRAAAYNARHRGRRLRGAGTITPCSARGTSSCGRGGSYLRKGLEVSLSPVLELAWGKRRILEVYLNVIEWGDGLYGVGRGGALLRDDGRTTRRVAVRA